MAALVYVYDHASRDLSRRLVQNFHGHHDLSLATLHVHLDDHNCMELTALQGPTEDVQHFADHVIAERGVKYGRVITIPHQSRRRTNGRGNRTHTEPSGMVRNAPSLHVFNLKQPFGTHRGVITRRRIGLDPGEYLGQPFVRFG